MQKQHCYFSRRKMSVCSFDILQVLYFFLFLLPIEKHYHCKRCKKLLSKLCHDVSFIALFYGSFYTESEMEMIYFVHRNELCK